MNICTVVVGENKYEKYHKTFFDQGVSLNVIEIEPNKEFNHFNNPYKAQANYERLQAIYANGGYYVDSDYFLINIFPDHLKENEYILTKTRSGKIINSFFGVKKHNNLLIKKMINEIEANFYDYHMVGQIGSVLFNKYELEFTNALYVGEDYYSNTKGYLFHDSLRARSY